jgi:hypothetical protein
MDIKMRKRKRKRVLQPAVEEEERKGEFGRKYFHAKSFSLAPLFFLLSVILFTAEIFRCPDSYYGIIMLLYDSIFYYMVN